MERSSRVLHVRTNPTDKSIRATNTDRYSAYGRLPATISSPRRAISLVAICSRTTLSCIFSVPFCSSLRRSFFQSMYVGPDTICYSRGLFSLLVVGSLLRPRCQGQGFPPARCILHDGRRQFTAVSIFRNFSNFSEDGLTEKRTI